MNNRYTYISAIVKNHEADGLWYEEDIRNMRTRDILVKYREVYVNLNHVSQGSNNLVLRMSNIRDKLQTSDLTFIEWLNSNQNKSLSTFISDIHVHQHKVIRRDAIKAGFKIGIIGRNAALDDPNHRSLKDDLFLTKEKVYPWDVHRYCLASVNGYFHYLDASDQGNFIIDGYKTIRHSNNMNHVSLYSFEQLGRLKVIPIKENMIYKLDGKSSLYDRCYIDIGKSHFGKTIILVIGGYFHILDWLTFRRINETCIRIDLKNMPYINRIQESMEVLDMDHLFVDKIDSKISVDEITSDTFIKKYLTMSQSFIVLLDAEEVYLKKHYLHALPAEGRYISSVEPTHMMVTGIGRMGEYWDVYDHNEWLLTTRNGTTKRRAYQTTNYDDLPVLDGRYRVGDEGSFSRSYLLEIGKYEIEIKKKK